MHYDIPAQWAQTISETHGAAGTAWLATLPTLLSACAQRWSLTIQPPFALSYNYVAPATRADRTTVVLKVGVPSPNLSTEIATLQHYAGCGAVRLLDSDGEQGMLLLERLSPGTPLTNIDDEHATTIAARVMRQLWRPAPGRHTFPTVAQWLNGLQKLRQEFGGATGPFPANIVGAAEQLSADLVASMDAPVLLHGDLHHDNILAAERQPWLAIDPKGVVGEAVYEVGALLRNPVPELLVQPHPERLLRRRVELLAAELGFDRKRVAHWGFVQAVLAAWWMYEDHERGWEPSIRCAELLLAIAEEL